mgnify:CR=1 FL=1
MSQTSNDAYDQRMADPSKSVDYILAIAGWSTLYSVGSATYTLAGDLANFTSIRAWLSLPSGAGSKVKARPEEGKMTIGQLDVGIQDKTDAGVRAISDLCSRDAYLYGVPAGTNSTTLTGAHTRSVTTLTVASTTGFDSSGNVYIGQECVKYTGVTATTFTGCTRGYLLTDAMPHATAVKVYDFMPSLYRRPAYLYKGDRSLTLGKWLKGFGGLILSDAKHGPTVTLTIASMSWEMYRNQQARVMNPWTGNPKIATPVADVLGGDYTGVVVNVNSLGNLNNGHYVLQLGGTSAEIVGIRAAV